MTDHDPSEQIAGGVVGKLVGKAKEVAGTAVGDGGPGA